MILRLNRADSGGEVDLIANQIVALIVETDGNTTVLTACGVSYKVTETARKLRFAIKRELSALTNAVRNLDDDDEAKEDAASANSTNAAPEAQPESPPYTEPTPVAPTPVGDVQE